MVSFSQSMQRRHWSKLLVIVLLMAIAAIAAIPNYVSGTWPWTSPPEVAQINHLQSLRQNGLTVPGWETLNQQVGQIGGNRWSIQELKLPDSLRSDLQLADMPSSVLLLLLPQVWHPNQPQVEWIDLQGAQQWNVDAQRTLQLQVSVPTTSNKPVIQRVQARFLRGWNRERTFAVLQWYAWPEGGSPAPGQWFWADQWSQWRDRRRTPWVAVSILIPIKPLGDIGAYQTLAESIGTTVQTALLTGPLQPPT